MTPILTGQSAWQAAVWFWIAIALLDSFDITLPRGDSIGVSGALIPSSLFVLGAGPAAAVAVGGLVIGHAVDRDRLTPRGLLDSLGVRAVSFGAAFATSITVASRVPASPVLVQVILASSAYLFAELVCAQVLSAVETRRPFGRLFRGNLRRQALMLAAQVSAAALVVTTYRGMQAWSLVPVVALLLLMRQSYALLLEMRETYRTTVEILVEAAEGQESRLRGHAERSAHVAREICMRLGLSAREVERASYSALLHDVYAIAGHFGQDQGGGASSVLEGVEFFADVLPVLRVCDGNVEEGSVSDGTLLLAMVVSLASDIDVSQSPSAALAHAGSAVSSVAGLIPQAVKARAVAAAIELGYETPAVG